MPFSPAAGSWSELTADIPAQAGQTGILRLHLPAGDKPVEVDWIELAVGGKTRRWDF
jgi:hypothetical protein